jgi:hypothetical protein
MVASVVMGQDFAETYDCGSAVMSAQASNWQSIPQEEDDDEAIDFVFVAVDMVTRVLVVVLSDLSSASLIPSPILSTVDALAVVCTF